MARLLLGSLLALLGLQLAISSLPLRNIPGSPRNISADDRDLKEAALTAVYTFNNQSNDAFFFKTSAIRKAQRQIVNGIRYIIDSEISRTVCSKRKIPKDLLKCDFQPQGQLQQAFRCHFEVLVIPWKHLMKTLFFRCKP